MPTMSTQSNHEALVEDPIAPKVTGSRETGADKEAPTEKSEVRAIKPLSWFLVVFSLLAALFLFALDNTIVADVQANIIYTFGGIDRLPWVSVAFALGAVSTNLFW
jgi:hypothetical protein